MDRKEAIAIQYSRLLSTLRCLRPVNNCVSRLHQALLCAQPLIPDCICRQSFVSSGEVSLSHRG